MTKDYNALHPFKPCGAKLPVTRQMERAANRLIAFIDISVRFPGEPRSIRRAMANAKGNRAYREAHNLPEIQRDRQEAA